MNILLKIWIKLKMLYARYKGWIHSLKKELCYMKDKSIDDIKGLEYKPDVLSKYQWDFQFDSIETFRRKGADCNSIHRCYQCFWYLQGFKEAYLITFVHKPLKHYHSKNLFKLIANKLGILKAHSSCIYKHKDHWFSSDYGSVHKFDTFQECINQIAGYYKVKVMHYVMQDIKWRFVNAASK